MGLRLKICRETCGAWSVRGPSLMSVSTLPSLSASIEYARKACNAAPATLELFVDELYIVVHQERGWPRQLVPQKTDRVHPGETPSWLPTATEPAFRRLRRTPRLVSTIAALLRRNSASGDLQLN
jgi:hypothetical protein